MKHFAKLMLLTLGIGVVAVVVSFVPRHTFAQAPPPPPPEPPNSLITLSSSGGSCFKQVLANGTFAASCFTVPTNQYFVLTDIEWSCYQGYGTNNVPSSGMLVLETLNTVNGALWAAPVQVGPNPSNVGFRDHLTTGIVLNTAPVWQDNLVSGFNCAYFFGNNPYGVMILYGFGSPGPPTVPPLQ